MGSTWSYAYFRKFLLARVSVIPIYSQVEATGSEKVVNDSINYVRKGGTLLIYSLYAADAMVHWSPDILFLNEIKVSEYHTSFSSFDSPSYKIGDHIVRPIAVLFTCHRLSRERDGESERDGTSSLLVDCSAEIECSRVVD